MDMPLPTADSEMRRRLIQRLADAADLTLTHRLNTQLLDQPLHLPRRHAIRVGLHHHPSKACSERLRALRKLGRYDPCRSFGIASSIVPTRVSHSRERYPLR